MSLRNRFANLTKIQVTIVASIMIVAMAGFLASSNTALAGVGLGVSPSFPSTVIVGNTNVPVALAITNNSDGGDGNPVDLTSITLIPSCGANSGSNCTSLDPGVFSVDSPGTGADTCAGRTFTIAIVDVPSGKVSFTPDATVTLGLGQKCTINFTVDVVGIPDIDASGSTGIQTKQIGEAAAVDHNDLDGGGFGTDTTKVDKASPTLTTTASGNVAVGGQIHDTAHLAGGTNPTGTISFNVYGPGDTTCTTPLAPQPTGATVNGNGNYDSGNFTAASVGTYRWIASYSGDGNNNAVTTLCNDPNESVVAVDARITVTQSGTNQVNSAHTFTVLVEKNDGTGWSAASGVTINSTELGVGDITGGTCGPAGSTDGSGQCTVIVNSSVPGTSTVNASGTVTVGGVGILVATDGYGAHDISNTKTWVNAKIAIAPNATNEVGAPHTFTVTLQKDPGTGFVPAAGESVDVTLTGTNGAVASPAGPFNGTTNASGQFQVTFTSATAGTVTGHASSILSVGGSASFTVQTDGVAPNSGDAVKTFVDANIQITPALDTNPVNDTHVLTGHVNINAGGGLGFVNAPDGTQISFTIDSGPGSFTSTNPCTTAGGTGSCTINLTSAAVGTSVVSAHVTLSVGGVSLARHTDAVDDNSGPATKNWFEVALTTTASATIALGDDITDTAHLSGGVDPTGTITFNLYGPDDATCATSIATLNATNPVTGNGDYTSEQFTPTLAGTYRWIAHYSGGNENPAVDTLCNDPGESVVVSPATPEIETVPSAGGVVGTQINDSATVSGGSNPTGTVTFWLFAPGDDCSNNVTAVFTDTKPLTAGSAGPTGNYTTVALGTYHWKAMYSGDANNNSATSDCDEEPVTITQNPTIDIEKATNGEDADLPTGPVVAVGSTVNWTYEVTNTGDVTLTNVTVTDDQPGVIVTCPKTTLAPAESMTCTASGTATAGQYANIGSVVGTPPVGSNVSDTDPSHYFGGNSAIEIVKKTNGEDANTPTGPVVAVGSTVNWTYEVTNTGNTVLTNVTVTDDKGVTVTCPKTTLAIGESMTCTASGTAVPGQYVNNGTVEGTTPTGGTVTDSDPSHYFCPVDLPCPAGSFTSSVDASGNLNIVYDQFPAPNDNSYGVNAVGWGDKGHTFGNLTGSDKAGFQIKNPSGTVVLSFNMDYLSAKTGTPSGFASLGAFGGDGSVVTGTLTPADATFESSLQRNLNGPAQANKSDAGTGGGFCTALNCTVGGVNLLVDSPPTVDTVSNYTLTNPAHTGWDFHDTYYVMINKAKLQAIGFLDGSGNPVPGWTVEPNLTVLHNSPAKPCPNAGDTGLCESGQKPQVLVMTYHGADSTNVSHDQDDGKVIITGDATGASPVRIKAYKDASHVWFDGTVADGETFAIDATNAGETRLGSATIVEVYDLDTGDLLQTINFHTSCSQPMNLGDVYGSITLSGMVGDGGFSDGDTTADVTGVNPPTPPPGTFDVDAGTVTIKDKDLKVMLTNNGSEATITKVTVSWPAADGKLQKVQLGGKTIYDNPHLLPPGPANITTFKGNPLDHVIGAGIAEEFKLHFEKKIVATGYSITIEFGVGNEVVISVP